MKRLIYNIFFRPLLWFGIKMSWFCRFGYWDKVREEHRPFINEDIFLVGQRWLEWYDGDLFGEWLIR